MLILLTFSSVSSADERQYWGEFGSDLIAPGGVSVNFGTLKGNSGWTLSFHRINQELALSSVRDRISEDDLEPSLDAVSVLKTWGLSGSWWKSNVSAGLGYATGVWGSNCELESTFIVSSFLCDIENINTFGVPVKLTAAIGKYAGIGAELFLFITPERRYGSLSIVIPIGRFTK